MVIRVNSDKLAGFSKPFDEPIIPALSPEVTDRAKILYSSLEAEKEMYRDFRYRTEIIQEAIRTLKVILDLAGLATAHNLSLEALNRVTIEAEQAIGYLSAIYHYRLDELKRLNITDDESAAKFFSFAATLINNDL